MRGFAVVLATLAASAGAPRAADLGFHQPAGITDPCGLCHDTAQSSPVLRSWAGTVGGAPGTWGAKPISSLCYMCHDSGGGGFGGHDMSANAYADASHSFVVAEVPAEPEGSVQGARYGSVAASGLPYVLRPGLECTSCHNVHRPGNRPFLHRPTVPALCDACHEGRSNSASLTSVPGFTRAYSTHPTSQLLGDTARSNLKAAGDIDAQLRTAVPPAAGWALGGHLSDAAGDTGAINCQTCHAVHGPALGTPGLADLLTIDNATPVNTATPSRLCEGCHFGGAAGEQVGSVVTQASLAPGQWSDHPIDANANRAFYPTGAALPGAWTGAQPFYLGQAPVCSSCHVAHGGIADTPLLRGPQAVAGWAALDYDDWCFSCHATALVLPAAHHSTSLNLAISQGDAINSQLSCGDCHGPALATDWRAHNGFWAWPVAYSPASGAFCQACHNGAEDADPTDLVSPALKGQTFTEPAAYPATHGTARGGGSHYLGPDSGEFDGVTPKLTSWPSSGYFSSYGPPNTGGGGDVAATQAGEIICQSCHHILYNDGRANPGNYTSPAKAGWQANLLLQPYVDDPPGNAGGVGAGAVGSALCTGCHDPAVGNHHPITGYPALIPLSGLPLRTGSGSFADQTSAPVGGGAAPGTLSYPGDNLTDCDSCHRPHRADDDSDVAGAAHGSKTSTDGRATRHILEVDGATHSFSQLCLECHAR